MHFPWLLQWMTTISVAETAQNDYFTEGRSYMGLTGQRQVSAGLRSFRGLRAPSVPLLLRVAETICLPSPISQGSGPPHTSLALFSLSSTFQGL